MDNKTQSLIQVLAGKHQKKPFWKSFHVLLTLWLILNISVFAFEVILAKNLLLSSSYFLFGLNLVGAILSWVYFTLNLNRNLSKKWDWIFLCSLIGLIAIGFSADYLAGFIGINRSAVIQTSDVSCFNHILVSAIPAVIIYSVFINNFFILKPYWTIAFMGSHIFLMATTAMELKCHDREFWHLLLGHQTTYLPIFMILTFFYFLKQRLRSSVV